MPPSSVGSDKPDKSKKKRRKKKNGQDYMGSMMIDGA
jgi:hypothetical protein